MSAVRARPFAPLPGRAGRDARARVRPAAQLRAIALACLAAAACAHGQHERPSAATLGRTPLFVAEQVAVSGENLVSHAAALRRALVAALADEGFLLGSGAPGKGALLLSASIDYTPWTSVSASSLYLVLELKQDGLGLDTIQEQTLDEAFPEDAAPLCRKLAHALATSPRTLEVLRTLPASPR